MTGEKQHIGYVGDMPAIVSTFRNLPDRGGTDIRIVATLGTSKQQCNIFLVRNEAPDFADQEEAIRWMDGKTVSTPQGSCTDRIAQATFKQEGVKPKDYLNQPLELPGLRRLITAQGRIVRAFNGDHAANGRPTMRLDLQPAHIAVDYIECDLVP